MFQILSRFAPYWLALASAAGFAVGGSGSTDFIKDIRPPPPESTDNVASLPTGDPEIAAATQMARRTLPRFFELSRARLNGTYALKMSIEQGGEIEHIWMSVEAYRDGVFRGRLANDPKNLGRYKFGDAVTLREADIEDWMVNTGEHRYGAYTIRVLLKHMPPKEAEALRKQIRD